MTASNYVGPSYQLTSGKSWSFRFGPQKLSGGKFPNQTKCNEARKAKISEFQIGTAQAQPNKNFGVILDELEAWERERLKSNAITDVTLRTYLTAIGWIRPEFGPLRLKYVTHARIQKFQQALIDGDRLAESKHCRTIWRNVFDLCCREGYCALNLARVGEPIKARGDDPRTQVCTDEQYARLISVTAKGWPWLDESQRLNIDAALKLARFHRCRRQDICGLRPVDLEWDHPPFGWIWFQRAWCPTKLGFKSTKGSSTGKGYRRKKEERRHQPMLPEVRDALWLVWQRVKPEWERAGRPDDWSIFRSGLGKNYYDSLRYHFQKAMKLAGNVGADGKRLFHLHDLRRIDTEQSEILGITAADYATLLGNSEAVARLTYMNAGQDVQTEAQKARLIELMSALAPKPVTPPLLLTCHESDTTDKDNGGK